MISDTNQHKPPDPPPRQQHPNNDPHPPPPKKKAKLKWFRKHNNNHSATSAHHPRQKRQHFPSHLEKFGFPQDKEVVILPRDTEHRLTLFRRPKLRQYWKRGEGGTIEAIVREEEERRVDWTDLFYDLFFVLALSQLGNSYYYYFILNHRYYSDVMSTNSIIILQTDNISS